MRITVNVTSSSNNTRLRKKNNNTTNQTVEHPQDGEEQFIYRMNSPEFDRTENVFLNGTLLGLSASEIDARLDAILEFADIGDFINQ